MHHQRVDFANPGDNVGLNIKGLDKNNTSPHSKTSDNKTCRWKFENGQICGKVFTKTYNLTVHMRMHQDIRPFPCTICEQTFRQKAHLQRHEATHGIDSTAGRKRRKKSLLEMANDGQVLIRKQ